MNHNLYQINQHNPPLRDLPSVVALCFIIITIFLVFPSPSYAASSGRIFGQLLDVGLSPNITHPEEVIVGLTPKVLVTLGRMVDIDRLAQPTVLTDWMALLITAADSHPVLTA